MMVRVQTGTSFKGAALYLLHDKRQEGETERFTSERVPWTLSLNTMEDDPWQVIGEMQKTCFDAPMLRLMSGNRIDGRPVEKPVMTVSMAWSPDQAQPDRAGMIAAAKDYLNDRGWGELQVLMMPHTDERHAHIHLLINRVHPHSGMAADQGYRNHNALLWAQNYDAKQGFFLEQREAKYTRGEKTAGEMTRTEWEAWKAAGGTVRPGAAELEASRRSGEWDALKVTQQDARKAFFKETTTLRAELRKDIRAAVKSEFADQWQEYRAYRDHQQAQQVQRDAQTRRQLAYLRKYSHGMQTEGMARLEAQRAQQHALLKADLYDVRSAITEAQTARVAALAKPALVQLQQERDAAYEALKASHRDEKKELHQDQAAGTRRSDLMQRQHAAVGKPAEMPHAATTPTRPQEPGPPPYHAAPQPVGMGQAEAVRRNHVHGTTTPPESPAAGRAQVDRKAFIQAARALHAQDMTRGPDDDGGRERDR